MSVQRKPKKAENTVSAFVQGAPDAASASAPGQGVRRGRKRQISITLDDGVLDELDQVAHHQGMSRAAAIAQACRRWIDAEK